MTHDITFYSWSVSLYSGKARSYLIKQGADFRDVSPANPRYETHIRPTIGRWIIPVMETANGEIIQDGAAIIDWYEVNRSPRLSAFPPSPKQLIVSYIMEMFGGEGLLRPAMHYRWNFDADNLDFITQQFGLFAAPHETPEERHAMALHASNRMRKACAAFGVNETTIPAIEQAYMAFLAELNRHFTAHPYLLGGVPTLGDYGLFAALYAHLGRDPHPAHLMKKHAPAVYRWTERMNASGADFPEFIDYPEALIGGDDIADTLMVLLRRVADDYLPEIKAMVACHNNFATHNQPDVGALVGGKSLGRGIGMCQFEWRGVTIECAVMPYRVFMLQRIQDAYDNFDAIARAKVDVLLQATGLSDIITTRCLRRIERKNHLEIWGGKNRAA